MGRLLFRSPSRRGGGWSGSVEDIHESGTASFKDGGREGLLLGENAAQRMAGQELSAGSGHGGLEVLLYGDRPGGVPGADISPPRIRRPRVNEGRQGREHARSGAAGPGVSESARAGSLRRSLKA